MFREKLMDYTDKLFYVRGDINRNDMAGAFCRAWSYVFTNQLRGDYLEFGVYRGNSLLHSWRNLLESRYWISEQLKSPEEWRRTAVKEYANFTQTFHALDTFEGLPTNAEGDPSFAGGGFKSDLEEVKQRCSHVGLVSPQIKFYKGLFSDTAKDLHNNVTEKAAIINIDCDLYQSAADALRICERYIQLGTVLFFDDYNAFCADNKRGERRAFKEFQEHSSFIFEKWFPFGTVGQAFLCVDEKIRDN